MEEISNHFDSAGQAVMVDVSEKESTARMARAGGFIQMNEAAFSAIEKGNGKKGDVLGVARIAGIMAAKQCSALIPLCHPVATEKATIEFILHKESSKVEAICSVLCTGKTGVEMEALCGASLALLTIYDMCKAIDRAMVIHAVRLLEKRGGKSGHFLAEDPYAV